jgi:hypothetical protein
MKVKNYQLPKFPKSRTKTLVNPLVWAFFASSTLLFVSMVFLTTVTSNGPTFISPQEVEEKLLGL